MSPESSLVEKYITEKATLLGHSIMEKNIIPGIILLLIIIIINNYIILGLYHYYSSTS